RNCCGAKSNRDVRVGSKGEILDASRCFPLFTQQRTSLNGVGMSVRCQERTRDAFEITRQALEIQGR
ncbi:MAG: hypothetical protein WCF83_08255, partial [Pseudolabrys sp.]